MTNDVYTGNHFDISLVGGEWSIWRISSDDGEREQIILTQDAMDELARYFADDYAALRREFAAQREP